MRDRFLVAWRTAAQVLFALLLAWLIDQGVNVPESISGPVELAIIAAGTGVWAAGTHWLQTREGDSWWARTARALARVLLLGAGTAPQYTRAGQ